MLTRGILLSILAAGTVMFVAGGARAADAYCYEYRNYPTGRMTMALDNKGPSADFGGSGSYTQEIVTLRVQVPCPYHPEPPEDKAAKWVAVLPSPIGIPSIKARSGNAFTTFSAADTCGAVGMVPTPIGGNTCKSAKRPSGGGAFNTSATMGAVFYAVFGSATHFGVKSGTHINFSPTLCDSESREGTGVALLTETPEKYVATHYACAPAVHAQRF